MKQQLVSVIIPIYNTEKYLHKCLDSVINQTYKNLEIILINDGSTDNSQLIINEYQKKDRRIHCYYQINSGQGKARNQGIDKSCGEFILFIDSDDYISETMVEVMINHIMDCDIVICGTSNVDEEYKLIKKHPKFKNDVINQDNAIRFGGKDPSPWNKLFKRNLILDNNINFPIDYTSNEDFIFVIKALYYSKRSCTIENVLYNYVQRAGSNTKQYTKGHIYSLLKVIHDVEIFENSVDRKYHKSFSYIYSRLILDDLGVLISYSNRKDRMALVANFYNVFGSMDTISLRKTIVTGLINRPKYIKNIMIASMLLLIRR